MKTKDLVAFGLGFAATMAGFYGVVDAAHHHWLLGLGLLLAGLLGLYGSFRIAGQSP